MRLFPCLLLMTCLTVCGPVFAQAQIKPVNGEATAQPKTSNKKQPVEIEADNQLEWLRDKAMYRASGNVMIKQGDTIIRGDNAEAHYDAKKGPSGLTTMTVTGNVTITNLDRVIHADNGNYDAVTQNMVLTGKEIVLTTPDMKVTAQDAMEYNAAQGKAVARGNAHIVQQEKDLKADTITAWTDKGTNKLSRAEAVGHVVIVQNGKDGKSIAQSERAVYNVTNDSIDMLGKVQLTRGSNHMEGDHATVDMKTGYSSLKNSTKKGGRVRAIFTPGDSSSPLPNVTSPVPMVDTKKNLEQPYTVGVKQNERQERKYPTATLGK